MANEYLKRTPTSTGNRKVWTWSGWVKRNSLSGNVSLFSQWNSASYNGAYGFLVKFDTTSQQLLIVQDEYTARFSVTWAGVPYHRDASSWLHFLVVANSTITDQKSRIKAYINGSQIDLTLGTVYGTWNQNDDFSFNHKVYPVFIGAGNPGTSSTPNNYFIGEMVDTFFIDGQALTPDVFGFYKAGKGYISAGSAQATDFRPGQWVPKTPRVIKTAINNNGGFGVNGFYLPMNDSNNFGADFHGTPNSIIKLQENLPQPRCRIDGVGDYTGALRDDPFKQYLVLALPFVSGGLQSGFGDYSAAIKGSGIAVSLTNAGVSIASTASYYGSAAFFNNANAAGTTKLTGDSSAVNFGSGDWTVEGWIFPTQIYNYLTFITTRPDNNGYADGWYVGSDTNGTLAFYSNAYDVQTANGTIKTNQWTHFAAVRKSNNLTLYANGVAVGINTNYTKTPTRTLFGIGQFPTGNTEAFPGYMQDLRIYKGVAKYKGGFDVPRPYTPVGIESWRAVPDTTANNFATLNPLEQTNGLTTLTFSEGNNRIIFGGSSYNAVSSTFGVTTGKYYFECRFNTQYVSPGIGGNNTNPTVRVDSGGIYLNEVLQQSGLTSQASGQIFGIALDRTNSSVQFYLNGSTFGSSQSFSANSGQEIFARIMSQNAGASSDSVWNFGQNPTFSGQVTAGTNADDSGKGLFKYQPPSGFLSLCEDNLPTPAISDPGEHFKTVLYTGSGSTRGIVGVGFKPDLVWVKSRTNTEGHIIFDSVRGPNQRLLTMTTSTEGTSIGGVMSFDDDGYSTAQYTGTNQSGQNYVAWCWKAGGEAVTNTDGSITSQVSVNQTAGFSIVSWTASGATSTIGHGLGKVPKFIIAKSRTSSGYGWTNYHTSLGKDAYIMLHSTVASASSSNYWGTSSPSTTVFGVAPFAFNNNSGNMIAYCWAEIEGFSKFGSYVGNGSDYGPFVYTGGRPAFVMIKRTDSTNDWYIHNTSTNPTNPSQLTLLANTSDIEGSLYNHIDILSNGFKCRKSDAGTNASGGTYIFACWMESPFQTANAK